MSGARCSPPSPGRRRIAGKGAKPEPGKVPSMLKQDEAVNVVFEPARLRWRPGQGDVYRSRAALAGQNHNQRRHDRRRRSSRNLAASGNVHTVMFVDEVDSVTKTKRLARMDAIGEIRCSTRRRNGWQRTDRPDRRRAPRGNRRGTSPPIRFELFLMKESKRARARRGRWPGRREGGRSASRQARI